MQNSTYNALSTSKHASRDAYPLLSILYTPTHPPLSLANTLYNAPPAVYFGSQDSDEWTTDEEGSDEESSGHYAPPGGARAGSSGAGSSRGAGGPPPHRVDRDKEYERWRQQEAKRQQQEQQQAAAREWRYGVPLPCRLQNQHRRALLLLLPL